MARLTSDQAAALTLIRSRIFEWRDEIEDLKSGRMSLRRGDEHVTERAVARLQDQIAEAERLLEVMDPEGLTVAGEGQ